MVETIPFRFVFGKRPVSSILIVFQKKFLAHIMQGRGVGGVNKRTYYRTSLHEDCAAIVLFIHSP